MPVAPMMPTDWHDGAVEAHHCSLLLLGQWLVQWVRWWSRPESCWKGTVPLSSDHGCQRLQRHRLHTEIRNCKVVRPASARNLSYSAIHGQLPDRIAGIDEATMFAPSFSSKAATSLGKPACPHSVGPSCEQQGIGNIEVKFLCEKHNLFREGMYGALEQGLA